MKSLIVLIICAGNFVFDINCNIAILKTMTNSRGTFGGYYDSSRSQIWINKPRQYRGNYPQTVETMPHGIPFTISTTTEFSINKNSTTILPVTISTARDVNTTVETTFNPISTIEYTTLLPNSATKFPISLTITENTSNTSETSVETSIQPVHNRIDDVCKGLHGNFVPDSMLCGRFNRCVWGQAYSFHCAKGTLYDSKTNQCLFSYMVNCGTRKL